MTSSQRIIIITAFICLAAPINAAIIPQKFARASNSTGFLTQNGIAAQQLNLQFASLQQSDSCTDNQEGCVSGSFAQCTNGEWQLTTCGAGTSCFALPLVNKAGTSVSCDSQSDALARIEATGVSGGITGQDTSSTPSGNSTIGGNGNGVPGNGTTSGDPGEDGGDGTSSCDGEGGSTSTAAPSATSTGDASSFSINVVFTTQLSAAGAVSAVYSDSTNAMTSTTATVSTSQTSAASATSTAESDSTSTMTSATSIVSASRTSAAGTTSNAENSSTSTITLTTATVSTSQTSAARATSTAESDSTSTMTSATSIVSASQTSAAGTTSNAENSSTSTITLTTASASTSQTSSANSSTQLTTQSPSSSSSTSASASQSTSAPSGGYFVETNKRQLESSVFRRHFGRPSNITNILSSAITKQTIFPTAPFAHLL